MEIFRGDVKRGRISKKKSGSKKGMFKKGEMMMSYEFCHSDLENDVSSTRKKKRSKLSKNSIKESNGVDHHHASVPRKLRSAMKKRNLESLSKRLNRVKTGIEYINTEEMVSKDEKEVAETLAGMFTLSDSTKVDSISVKLILDQSDNQHNSTGFILKESNSVVNAREIAIETTSETDMGYNKGLWPGLSSGSHRPSSTNLPPWMSQAVSTPPRRKLKKCASHIYISHLIKVLQKQTTLDQLTSKVQEEDITNTELGLNTQTSQKNSYHFLSTGSPLVPQYNISSAAYNSQLTPATYLPNRFRTAYNHQLFQKRLWATQYTSQALRSSMYNNNSVSQQQQHRFTPEMSINQHHHHQQHSSSTLRMRMNTRQEKLYDPIR